MILSEHAQHHRRLAKLGVFQDPMLMLGNQEDCTGELSVREKWFPKYTTLDPDGGNLDRDLNILQRDLFGKFCCVYNVGTIEHVWDIHTAFVNAACMVQVDGYYAGHTPCGGWENHGIHVTSYQYIINFFAQNGFQILDGWLTNQQGGLIARVERGDSNNVLHWIAAKKVLHIDPQDFKMPQQVFKRGRPI